MNTASNLKTKHELRVEMKRICTDLKLLICLHKAAKTIIHLTVNDSKYSKHD